jgi:TPP-dependent pyruvate/acetoin dehydrogenase alpha subunit
MERDPIPRFRNWALQAGELRQEDADSIEQEVAKEVADAVAFAEAGTWEPVENLTHDVGAERRT